MGMSHRKLRDYLRLQMKDEPSDDLTDHAKLWGFADCYDIPDLRGLCLHKLHRDLILFNLSEHNSDAFIKLLEYIGTETMELKEVEAGSTSHECSLRNLVLCYAICHTDVLLRSRSFQQLVEAGGSIVKDYLKLQSSQLLQLDARSNSRLDYHYECAWN